MVVLCCVCVFKQKTAYEMRISDWSSDVCSSDLLLALAGAEVAAPPRFPVRAGFAYRKKAGRREYVRVKLERGADGVPLARRAGSEGAGVLSSLVAADGLVELADDTLWLSEGDTAAYLPFSRSEEHTSELQSLMRISYAVL